MQLSDYGVNFRVKMQKGIDNGKKEEYDCGIKGKGVFCFRTEGAFVFFVYRRIAPGTIYVKL